MFQLRGLVASFIGCLHELEQFYESNSSIRFTSLVELDLGPEAASNHSSWCQSSTWSNEGDGWDPELALEPGSNYII